MTDEIEEVVKVLYDYSYTDDKGQVEIKCGDVYRLVEKTNEEWWQVYNPSEANGESFFVPAQYVETVSEVSPWRTLSDLDKTLLHFEVDGKQELETINDDKRILSTQPNEDSQGEYMNLDLFRNEAGIPSQAVSSPPSMPTPHVKPFVPQELLQGTIPPPLPEDGTYIKVLLEGLSWDIYKEHSAGRLFYVNRETNERMWKPPRKERTPTGSTVITQGSIPKSPSSPVNPAATLTKEEMSGIPAEYEQVHDNGNIYFIHRSTQEKPREVNWESHGHRLSTFGDQSSRTTKAMSTYGNLESSSRNCSKASTLPANFTVARPAPVAPSITDRSGSLTSPTLATSLTPSNSTGSLQANDEVFGSYLNRAKLTEIGGGKRKSKKNWTQMYVVLQGSNLVFYKDQKAASQKPGSPHGRNEGVISLQGAHITFNPTKDITSKKNTIMLTVLSGSYFLFNSDSEKTIREWFTRMKLVANDISPDDSKELEEKKGLSRSISMDDAVTVDKNKNIVGLRAKLRNFISGRPSKEDLVKQGIIKDLVFGSRLNELCDREKVAVPKFVHVCIQAVEARGVKQDGLYRVSGNMAQIQKLRFAVDKDDGYDLYDEQWDIHVLTGALKLFFRELKDPLFPSHMYKRFVDAIQKDSKDQLSAFKSAVSNLPRCNYYTLKELFRHLCFVTRFSQQNRMQAQNLAIVFGPTLLYQECSTDSLTIQTVFQSRIVEFILFKCTDLFNK